LQHPGIVPVYDRGEFPDQRPFFTMKLVQGRTLADLLKERTRPDQDQARFLGIFEQIAQTMAYAHANGIIHRDLKPANVMVGAFGEVQVMDWGLAKVLAAEQRAGAEFQAAPLDGAPGVEPDRAQKVETERGRAMGTYQYMPPEQARGEIDRIDERSDVFGLGAILCEILTGRPPFIGKTREELSARAMACDHAEAFAALDQSGADADLVQLTKRCLAEDRQARPRNAGEAAGAMAAYLTSVAERKRAAELTAAKATARAASERKARYLTLGLAAALLVGTTVATTFGVQAHIARGEADQHAQNETAAKVEAQNEAERARSITAGSWARLLGREVLPGQADPWSGISPGLSDTEIEVLAELGETPDEKLRLRFVEEALRTPRTTWQLRSRAAFALHAAVGLDAQCRDKVEQMLVERLAHKDVSSDEFNDLFLSLVALGDVGPQGARQVSASLTRAMSQTTDPGKLNLLAQRLSAVAARLEAKDAKGPAAALAHAMSQTKNALALAHALSALAARLGPKDAK
jgi:hypothetical protein